MIDIPAIPSAPSIPVRLYCRFPDEATAVQVAETLLGREIIPDADGKKRFSADGWFARENAAPIYWNIDVCFGTGTIYQPTGATVDGPFGPMPGMAPVPGYHVNGLWHGDDGTLPDALRPFLIQPNNPAVVFG